MFIFPLKRNNAVITSSTSATTFLETDSIVLTEKRYDGKRLALRIDVTSGASRFFIYPEIGMTAAGTYGTFRTGSGTSMLGPKNTSAVAFTAYTSYSGNSRHYVPLTISQAGVTEFLTGVPYVKFGYRSTGLATSFKAWLIVG